MPACTMESYIHIDRFHVRPVALLQCCRLPPNGERITIRISCAAGESGVAQKMLLNIQPPDNLVVVHKLSENIIIALWLRWAGHAGFAVAVAP